MKRLDIEVRGKRLSLETGKMAKQADGAVVAQYGDTVVLATAVSEKTPKEGLVPPVRRSAWSGIG